MKTAVLGSGGGALAVAADLARGGREAVLADLPEFAANLDAVREQGGVKVSTGWLGLQQETVGVAPSIGDAVDGARLIVVVVPCFGHEPFMDVLAPLLVAGQSLLFLGEGSGSIVARRALAVAEAEGVVIGETNTLPYLARPVRPGVVTADRKTGGVLLAATPSSDTSGLLELVADVWPYVTATGSVWDTVLINYNAIDHVATMLANAGTLEARDGRDAALGRGGDTRRRPRDRGGRRRAAGDPKDARTVGGAALPRLPDRPGLRSGRRARAVRGRSREQADRVLLPDGPGCPAESIPDRGHPVRAGPRLLDRRRGRRGDAGDRRADRDRGGHARPRLPSRGPDPRHAGARRRRGRRATCVRRERAVPR